MLIRQVGGLARIRREIEELNLLDLFDHASPPAGPGRIRRTWQDEFPLINADPCKEAAAVVEVVVAGTLVSLSEQEGGRVMAVKSAISRKRGTRQPGEGWQQIHRRENFAALAVRRDSPGPTGDEGNLRSSIPGRHFPTPERCGRAGMLTGNEGAAIRLHPSRRFDPGSVVRGVDDECVVVDSEFFKLVEDLSGRPVDLFDGVTVGTVFGFALEVLRRSDGNVRHIVSEVEKEGLVPVLFDIVNRLLRVVGGDVVPALDPLYHNLIVSEKRNT